MVCLVQDTKSPRRQEEPKVTVPVPKDVSLGDGSNGRSPPVSVTPVPGSEDEFSFVLLSVSLLPERVYSRSTDPPPAGGEGSPLRGRQGRVDGDEEVRVKERERGSGWTVESRDQDGVKGATISRRKFLQAPCQHGRFHWLGCSRLSDTVGRSGTF